MASIEGDKGGLINEVASIEGDKGGHINEVASIEGDDLGVFYYLRVLKSGLLKGVAL